MANTTNGSICAEEYTVKRGDSFYLIAHKLGVPLRDLLAANSNIHPARLMVGDVLCVPREEDDTPSNGTGGTISGTTGTNGTTGSGTSSGTTNGTAGGTTGSGSNGTNGTTNGSNGNTNGSTGGNTGTNGSTGSTGSSGSTGGTTGSTGSTGSNGSNVNDSGILQCPLEDQLIVQRGQSVADIQLLNLVSRNTLNYANPNVDLDSLRVGQTICVPRENIPCSVPTTYTLQVSENLEAVAVMFNKPVASILRANPCLAPQDFEQGVTVVIPG